MRITTCEYSPRIAEPNVHPRTDDHVRTALEHAHERHLSDWIVEGRRQAYEEFILAKFGRLINEIDTELRTVADTSLWGDECYRIETSASRPNRPTVVHCSSSTDYLTHSDLELLQPRVRERVDDAFESKLHRAINETLQLYTRAVATFATRELLRYVNDYNELHGQSGVDGREGTPPETAVRTFELGDSSVTIELPTEAAWF